MKRFARLPVLLVAIALVAAACGSDSKVGSGVNLSETGGEGQAAIVDPARTTTTLAPEIEGQVAVSTTAPPTTAASQAQGPTTTTPQTVILIQDDEQGHYLDPIVAQVPAGQLVVWRNVSSKDRQVAAGDNSFASPVIPPGGEWTATFSAKGTIDYTDTTRPYASASLRVY
jgi:predicted small secreted protein/plastocyanin